MGMGAKAWACLITSVIVYDAVAPQDEMLSRVVDRALIDHPYLTVGAVSITALHLLNALPPAIDPFVWGFKWRGLLR